MMPLYSHEYTFGLSGVSVEIIFHHLERVHYRIEEHKAANEGEIFRVFSFIGKIH